MQPADPFDESQPFGQAELMAELVDLIREARSPLVWENATVAAFVGAAAGWLGSQQSPAFDSLERRTIGHFLFPPGDFSRLTDYFEAVRSRVATPELDWPAQLEIPMPDWRLIGKALSAAKAYE
jgi:hypothetical protein